MSAYGYYNFDKIYGKFRKSSLLKKDFDFKYSIREKIQTVTLKFDFT